MTIDTLTGQVRDLLDALDQVRVKTKSGDLVGLTLAVETARVALFELHQASAQADRVLERLVDVVQIEQDSAK